jgi:hypothetical protein
MEIQRIRWSHHGQHQDGNLQALPIKARFSSSRFQATLSRYGDSCSWKRRAIQRGGLGVVPDELGYEERRWTMASGKTVLPPLERVCVHGNYSIGCNILILARSELIYKYTEQISLVRYL